MITISAFSQNTAVEKALNDPNRAEKEAKADVFIQQKKILSDSMRITGEKTKSVNQKKKVCRRNKVKS